MKNIFKNSSLSFGKLFLLGLVLLAFACKKGNIIGEDPYKGAKQPLGIKFAGDLPDPDLAVAGNSVKVLIRGLKKFDGQFKFYVNQTEAEVLAFTDSTATIKVPTNASTGGLSVVAKGQTFFGPVLRIDGKVGVDDGFTTQGASYRDASGGFAQSTISDLATLASGNSVLVGSFNNFDNKWTEALPIGSIVQITSGGAYVADPSVDFGKGADGPILSINRLTNGPNNGKYLITGLFSNFASPIKPNVRVTMSSITRLNANGKVDQRIIDVINPTPNNVAKNSDTIPSFNGGVDGLILKSFVFNSRLYVVGNFKNYIRRYYDRSTYDTKVLDFTRMRQVACLKIDQISPNSEGELDSTYHFDPVTRQSPIAGNGNVNDAIQMADGKLVLVGSFTTFNGTTVNRIVRLNLDGSVDNSFNTSGGADAEISHISYNPITNKILVVGLFKNFAGKALQGAAMLNADGSLNTTFDFGTLTDGIPTFAQQLNNGKVIVSGNFSTYNGIVRQGFMVLNADASLAADYNNTGQFVGTISKIVEAPVGDGIRLTMVGNITRFDNRSYSGIVRILLKN